MSDTLISLAARGLTQASWGTWIVYLLVVTQLTIFAVTLYLHRSQTHRGVDFHPVVAHFFRFWSWLSTGMVTKEWVAIHRKHHAKVETEDDPHSPQVYGIRKVFWEGVELYREASENREDMEKYGRGTPDDRIERVLYSGHPYWGPTLMAIIDLALFGAVGGVIWAIQMVWIPFWAAGFVNGIGHWWGYRNFESADTSTNVSPWGFWIGGEELHNNHHAFPSSAKFALRKWEFDIGWVAIRGLEKLGLAKVLRVAPALDVRPNMNLPDTETVKALLSHRFHVMSDYFRGVIAPTLREEAANAGAGIKALPRKLRKALGNGGRWLDAASRERMTAFTEKHPQLRTVCEFRARLAELTERNGRNAEGMLEGLKEWCREAEQTGIRTLAEFAARLKGYRLAGETA
ncbi:DesA family fatty acid desaturase [Dokdonella fugitiva]|jgi:stearoyl-CoA desaturase (delta-9 desaturase)|uniref:Stearoyl-CoA desaturase (Delta-9 desaturase) n=1 Tax=Dokdonella fugitiva TaxID=328517 RepID=A0A4R2IAI1_9GAMM|nr:fatty acid desaturase [Dokdonella fugitiva]MBA8885169.1 stearoyl-CoA desaturase (delta-9 desaturase) [Dokdonella fugitiva]TCO41112.1 stearoyl-CoA desaturase (delta-9 desaturase) [Dokdonella fugitiva]